MTEGQIIDAASVRDMRKVQLHPDDVLIIHCDDRISNDTADRLKAHLHSVFGADRKVLIMSGGVRLNVYSPNPNAGE